MSHQRPHSRSCGLTFHLHGLSCASDCPTCHPTEPEKTTLEKLLEAQHTDELVHYETTPLTKTPPIESYPAFHLHGEDTLSGAIGKCMEARDIGVTWDVVRIELVRWVQAHYVRREEYDRVNSGKPALADAQRQPASWNQPPKDDS